MALLDQIDPIKFVNKFWPHLTLYKEQREILYSVWFDDETVVPAGHMLGKDFVSGLCALSFFITRHPCRIVSTSVDSKQLEGVLWGEIRRFIQTAKIPLDHKQGGPLLVKHLHIRKMIGPEFNQTMDGLSYIIGRVAEKGEGISGHHIAQTGDGIPRTLFLADEASGIDSLTFEKADEWANRKLIIGNPYECQNYFKQSVKGKLGTEDKGGNIPRNSKESIVPDPKTGLAPCDVRAGGAGYHRRIIKIKATHSPNVRFGLAEERAGKEPSNEILIHGVLPYNVYKRRRITWDKIKQTVGLDAEFYEGAETLMFPPDWLDNSQRVAEQIKITKRRDGLAMGVDTAEGGDNTSWAIIDHHGLIYLHSERTPDTSMIPKKTIELIHRFHVPPERVCFDRGGGGKQHADRMKELGYRVATVHFGEAATLPKKKIKVTFSQRVADTETRTVYKNRRAEMYGRLRELIDPQRGLNHQQRIRVGSLYDEQTRKGMDVQEPDPSKVFALPEEFYQIRQQLTPIPLLYDGEGVMYLPPKHKRDGKPAERSRDTTETLTELIGHSPDEADSLVIALHALKCKEYRGSVKPMF